MRQLVTLVEALGHICLGARVPTVERATYMRIALRLGPCVDSLSWR